MPEIAPFAVYSLYSLLPGSGLKTYTWATLPTAAALDEEVLLSDSWTSAGSLITAKVSLTLKYTNADSTQPWEAADSTNQQQIIWRKSSLGDPGDLGTGWVNYDHIVLPAKITLTGEVEDAVWSDYSGYTEGIALGTTSAGTDICSSSHTGIGAFDLGPAAASGTTTFAASSTMYFVYKNSKVGVGGNSKHLLAEWRATISSIAGQAAP